MNNSTSISETPKAVIHADSGSDILIVILCAVLGTGIFGAAVYYAIKRTKKLSKPKNRALKYLDNSINNDNKTKKDLSKHSHMSSKSNNKSYNEGIKISKDVSKRNSKRPKSISKTLQEIKNLQIEKDSDKNSTDSQNTLNKNIEIVTKSPYKLVNDNVNNKQYNNEKIEKKYKYDNLVLLSSNSITKNDIFSINHKNFNLSDFSKIKIQRKFKESNSDWKFNQNSLDAQAENKLPKYEFKIDPHKNLKSKIAMQEINSLSDHKSSSGKNERQSNLSFSKGSEFEEKILEIGEECLDRNIRENINVNDCIGEIYTIKKEDKDAIISVKSKKSKIFDNNNNNCNGICNSSNIQESSSSKTATKQISKLPDFKIISQKESGGYKNNNFI